MVTWEQRITEGDAKLPASQDLPPFPYAAYAELLGLRGIRVNEPGQVAAAWEEALCSPVPTLLEMVTDPDVPPLPPHVSGKQAAHYLRALLRGDQEALGVVTSTIKEVWDGIFPRRKHS